MSQHFLLSAKARTISEVEVARMSEDEAREVFEFCYFRNVVMTTLYVESSPVSWRGELVESIVSSLLDV